MSAAKYSEILDAAVTAVEGLGLTRPGGAFAVVKGKAPKKGEAVDSAWQITVSAAEAGETSEPFGFGNFRVDYPLEVVIVTPNNGDNLTNLDAHAEWREAVRRLFQSKAPFAAVAGVWDSNAERGTFLDRAQMANNYDFQEVAVVVSTAEPAVSAAEPGP